jgi:type VI secretion system protein ImpF
MALNKNDRLAPPLMYAFRAAHEKKDAKTPLDLRDSGGERVIASRRVTSRSPISEAGLRREVMTDLISLFNTTNLDSAQELSTAPETRRSILNYGFPDLSWRTLDENGLSQVAREIEIALADFEPRLERNSIQARRDETAREDELKLRFLVKADLISRPLNAPLEFVAEIELDTGKFKIDRV